MTQNQGKFVWYELMTTDTAAAEYFYRNVIGWSARSADVPQMSYTLFTIAETPVAGLMAIPEKAAGARPGWMGYVSVDDVDASAKDVAQAGGTICHAPDDIPNVGRFAVVTDPQGSAIALFKPLPMEQQQPLDPRTPGLTGWHELHAADGPSAFDYYAKHFGWTKGDGLDMGPMGIYQLFNHDGNVIGGMFTKPVAEPVPYWLYYFNVDSITAAQDRVFALGGKILMGPHEVPGGSIILQCLDPQGAVFALVEPR